MSATGRVRQTICINCELDVEGYIYGYGPTLRAGTDWRDRGGNTSCPDEPTGKHAPMLTEEDYQERPPRRVRTRSKKLVPRARTSSTPKYREGCAGLALEHAVRALHYARAAGAVYSVERLQLAVSSLRGAVRHAENRRTRELMTGAKGGDDRLEG